MSIPDYLVSTPPHSLQNTSTQPSSCNNPLPLAQHFVSHVQAPQIGNSNTLIRIANKKEKLAVIRSYLQIAKDAKMNAFYAASMHTLESGMQEAHAKDGLLYVQPGIVSKILDEGGILIFECDRFPESPEVLNALLQERTYNGKKISPKVKIVGLVNEDALDKDVYSEAFLSRWDDKIDALPLQKALDVQKANDLELSSYPVVEFHSNPDFVSTLLGTITRTDHWECTFGPLMQPHTGLILKNAPWNSTDFYVFIQELLINREVTFNGRTVRIPEDFKLFSYDGYTDSEQRSRKAKIVKDAKVDPILINKENFSTLFELYRIRQNTIEHIPGLLFQGSAPSWVQVTETLSDDQWMRLIMASPACKISAARNVAVPDNYKEFVCIEEGKTQSCTRIYSSDVTYTSYELLDKHPDIAFIDVTPHTTYETLTFKITPEKYTAGQGIDPRFLVEEGPLLMALKNNRPICIRGLEHNPALEKHLVSLLYGSPYLLVNGQKVPCNQKVHLLVSKNGAIQYTIDDYLKKVPVADAIRTKWQKFLQIVHAHEPLSYLQVKSFLESVENGDGLEKYPFLLKHKKDPEFYAYLKVLFRAHTASKKQAKKKDTITKYLDVLNKHPALFLQGNPGVGKSYLLKQLAKLPTLCCFGPVTVGSLTTENDLWQACYLDDTSGIASEQKEIYKWVTNRDDALKLLLVDEANLTKDGFWNIFRGIFSEKPFIQIAGQVIELTKQHKVIFTGNPEIYEGRISHDILNKDFFTIYFPDLEDDFLIKEIILATLLGAQEKDAQYILSVQSALKRLQPHRVFSPRDLEEVCLRALFLGYPQNHHSISQALYSVYQGDLSDVEREAFREFLSLQHPWPASDTQFLNDKDFCLTPSAKDLAHAVLFALDMRGQKQAPGKQALGKRALGKRAMIIEGPAGRGKDTLLEKALQKTKTDFYHITAENIKNLQTTIKKAKEEGAVLVISELNLFPSQVVEGLLNDAITGDAKEGFFLFVTMNADLQKRNEFSPAFMNRCIIEKIPEYTVAELKEILKKSLSDKDASSLLRFHEAVCAACTSKAISLMPTARDLFKAAKAESITPTSIEKAYQIYLWRLKKNYHALMASSKRISLPHVDVTPEKNAILNILRQHDGQQDATTAPILDRVDIPWKSSLDHAPADSVTPPERDKVIGMSAQILSGLATRRYRIDEHGQACPMNYSSSFEKQGRVVNTISLKSNEHILYDRMLLLPVEINTMPQDICIIDKKSKSTPTAQRHHDGTWFIQLQKPLSQDAHITYSLAECKERGPTQQTILPTLKLKGWDRLQKAVADVKNKSVQEKVSVLCQFVKTNVTYSLTTKTKEALEDTQNGATWFERFLKTRSGGCAECARFLCTLLQDLGITARIASGPAVENKRIESVGHDIVEFYDSDTGCWKNCDPVAICSDPSTSEYIKQTTPRVNDADITSLTQAIESTASTHPFVSSMQNFMFQLIPQLGNSLQAYYEKRFAELERSYFIENSDYESHPSSHGTINISRAIKGDPNFFDLYRGNSTKKKKTVIFSKDVEPEIFEFFKRKDFKIAMLCKNGLIHTTRYDEFSAHTAELVDLGAIGEIKQKAQELGVTGKMYKFFDCTDYFTLQRVDEALQFSLLHQVIRHRWYECIKNVKSLKLLDLQSWNISSIESFIDLTELEELNLSYTYITNLKGIEKLRNLKKLTLHHCPKISRIDELTALTHLEELDLSHTIFTNFKGIEKLKNLKKLTLSNSDFFSSIDELTALTELEELDLSHTKITNLKGIEKLKHLKKLSLSCCQIESIEELAALTELEELDLSYTRIRNLKGIEKLKNLKKLTLYGCPIESIEELTALTELEELDLSFTNITNLKGIEKLKHLKKLTLYECPITSIDELTALTQLETLILARTKITDLKGIEKLTNLKYLTISKIFETYLKKLRLHFSRIAYN